MLFSLVPFKKYLLVILAVVLYTSALTSFTYYKAYNTGYGKAEIVYNEQRSIFNKNLSDKIDHIINNTDALAENNEKYQLARKKEFDNIINTIRNKPIYTVDGCNISKEYIDSYNTSIRKVNNE